MRFSGEWGGVWDVDETVPLAPAGGFGRVSPGRSADGRNVAVKRIFRQGLSGNLPSRLHQREREIAEALRSTSSEYLIEVLDVAADGEDVLIVMELAETSLAEYCGGAPLREAEAVAIILDIARGLEELHAAGIIHRDLKPANVLRVGGRWKLSDFGMARDVSIGTGSPTFVGGGTPPYMAPEVFLGSPNVKTDLYALGVIAYEALLGQLPFAPPAPADWGAWQRAHQTAAVRQMDEALNPVLRRLVLRLLSKEPPQRPQDARAVREALSRFEDALSPAQELVRRGAAEHETERSVEEAEAAAAAAAFNDHVRQREQGIADLRDICAGVAALLSEAASDVDYREAKQGIIHMFEGAHASLDVQVWGELVGHGIDDEFVLAGEVLGENRRRSGRQRLANVVYEVVQGRLLWHLYRFRKSPIAVDYYPGPPDRPHGLERNHFIEGRSLMKGGILHIWQASITTLTEDGLVRLFAEAMELPPAAS